MGRQKVLQKIKNNSLAMTITGALFILVSGLIVFFLLVSELKGDGISALILTFTCVGIIGIFMVFFGIRGLNHPEKTSAMKKNPDLLRQADELFAHVTYQDSFIILSDRIIANKKNITQMAFTDEVFLIYIYRHRTNFITTSKQLILQTARGHFEINIYGRKQSTIDELANRIARSCRYTRLGYTKENLKYVDQMRQLWKEDQTRNHKAV